MNNPRKLVPEGRLQRKALASEFYISKFRQVLMRHGLTMSIILFFCILTPYIPTALISSISELFINPNKYFIVSINMFGNGLSSSPTKAIKSQSGSKFPTITLWDNIYCQHKLITEKLKIKKIALVTGWSMAGCQSYQWAAQYPGMVKAILPFCASAKTSIHNHVFLEGVKAALTADKKFNKGNYKKQPVEGLKSFGRVYAGWAFSQDFYREKLYKKFGFKNAEELLKDWANDHAKNWDANNLLSKLKTWQLNDISKGPIYKNNYISLQRDNYLQD